MLDRPAVRGALVTAGLVLTGFLLVLAGSAVFGPVDAGSVALATCGAVLVYTLRRLFALVRTLSRPDALAQVGRGAGQFTQAELRDEKKRLLRAIKELEFDFGMGKLSQQDYDAVIGTYRLRAIEVMRALDGGGELHPELQRLLAERDKLPAPEPAAVAAAATQPAAPGTFDQTARICAACNGNNDNDARFCKHCGATLPRKGGTPPPPQSSLPVAAAGEIGA
jgi:hypothetical protein